MDKREANEHNTLALSLLMLGIRHPRARSIRYPRGQDSMKAANVLRIIESGLGTVVQTFIGVILFRTTTDDELCYCPKHGHVVKTCP